MHTSPLYVVDKILAHPCTLPAVRHPLKHERRTVCFGMTARNALPPLHTAFMVSHRARPPRDGYGAHVSIHLEALPHPHSGPGNLVLRVTAFLEEVRKRKSGGLTTQTTEDST